MFQHQATLYAYHGLLFDVYNEYLTQNRICSNEAMAETNIDGETPQYAALTFVDVFGILLVSAVGFSIALMFLIYELAKKYRQKIFDRNAVNSTTITTTSRRIIVRGNDFKSYLS